MLIGLLLLVLVPLWGVSTGMLIAKFTVEERRGYEV